MFGLFSNLLSELGGRANSSCSSDCYDSCSGVSVVLNDDCFSECINSCTGTVKTENGGSGTGGVCFHCFNSCTGNCSKACGWHTCGTVCNSVSSK